jgi:hypothetical protein
MQKLEINSHTYTVLEPSELSTLRKLNLQTDIETMEWRMPTETFDRYTEYILKCKSIEDIHRLTIQIQELRRLDISYSPVVNCTCNFILIDDEKNDKIDSKYLSLKKEFCRNDPQVHDFFLSNGLVLLTSLGVLSNISRASELLREAKLSMDQETIIWNQINRTFSHTLTGSGK